MKLDSIFIDGAWEKTDAGTSFPLHDPATDEIYGTAFAARAPDVDRAVRAAHAALPRWGATTPAERIALLRRVRDGIEARRDELARTVTQEMGTPLAFARAAQIGLPLRDIDAALRAMEAIEEEWIGGSLVRRMPVGVVVAITPWNFPLHQIAAKIAPALLAGCTIVLKPSEITPADAVKLAEIIEQAGLPRGVFNLVLGAGDTGRALVEHKLVDMISFTGSTAAGVAIATAAARDLKKVALELGGKSANIVLDDADLATAIPAAVAQCFVNAGQVCAALSRLLVPRARAGEIAEIAVAAAQGWNLGDPTDDATRMGPLSSRAQQARVRGYIDSGVQQGARLLTGGAAQPAGFARGAYVAPTVFADVTSDMRIVREEIFGPVLVLQSYDDEEDAIRLANDTEYGLSGGVWSRDLDRARRVAERMQTGQVVLNGAMLDVDAPFGGCKRSGLGRENGRYGLDEFFQLQAILGARAS